MTAEKRKTAPQGILPKLPQFYDLPAMHAESLLCLPSLRSSRLCGLIARPEFTRPAKILMDIGTKYTKDNFFLL